MRVKVFAPAWCSAEKLDERGWLELKEGATINDALRDIRMPRLMAKMLRAAINGETMPLDTELRDGDVVGFFSLMTGG